MLVFTKFTDFLFLVYAFYIIVVMISSLNLAVANGMRYMPHLPSIFFTVHFSLGYGFLCEALNFRESGRLVIVNHVSKISIP